MINNTHKCQELSDQIDAKFLELEKVFYKIYTVRGCVTLSGHTNIKLVYYPNNKLSDDTKGFHIKKGVYTHVTKVSMKFKIKAVDTLEDILRTLNFEQENLKNKLGKSLDTLSKLIEFTQEVN